MIVFPGGTMLRIGEISYANCLPLFHALRKISAGGNLIYVPGEPAVLNRMLFEGEVDLAPSSSFEYGLHPDQYLIVPGLSISSDQEIQSVLLLSRRPIEELQGRTILLSPASASSNALLKILLQKRYHLFCHYLHPQMEAVRPIDVPDAELTIGNSALRTHLKYEDQGYVYDLSVLWRDFTGLPFVFALWMVRREIVEKKREEVSRLIQELHHAMTFAQTHFSQIAREVEDFVGIDPDDLTRYWKSIAYDLDDDKIRSLKRYFDAAMDLDLIPQSPPLHFFS
jgi:chorismate dehydratase